MRKEHDFLGEKLVPDEVYYGVQTMRAMENFQITGAQLATQLLPRLRFLRRRLGADVDGRALRAETERLQAALATIKATGIVGPDQERAVAALKFKLAELRTEAAAIPGSAASAKTAYDGGFAP